MQFGPIKVLPEHEYQKRTKKKKTNKRCRFIKPDYYVYIGYSSLEYLSIVE